MWPPGRIRVTTRILPFLGSGIPTKTFTCHLRLAGGKTLPKVSNWLPSQVCNFLATEYREYCTPPKMNNGTQKLVVCTKNGSFWTMIYRVLTPFSVSPTTVAGLGVPVSVRFKCRATSAVQRRRRLEIQPPKTIVLGLASLKLTVRTWVHGWLVQMSFVFGMSH